MTCQRGFHKFMANDMNSFDNAYQICILSWHNQCDNKAHEIQVDQNGAEFNEYMISTMEIIASV